MVVYLSRKSGVEVSLANVGLVGKCRKTFHGHIHTLHRDCAIGRTGGDEKIHDFRGDGHGSAVNLNALKDVHLSACRDTRKLHEIGARHKTVLTLSRCRDYECFAIKDKTSYF